jgi:hypothetical protein
MRVLLALVFIIFTSVVIGQKKTSTVILNNEAKLIGVIEKFEASSHKIDTCSYEFKFQYFCRIDGQKWYGTDQGFELPQTQLNQLTAYINGQAVPLNVSGMFNPKFSLDLSSDQFKLVRQAKDYILYGSFSDGAGTYTVHWKISGKKSTRLKISTDERDFAWQIN